MSSPAAAAAIYRRKMAALHAASGLPSHDPTTGNAPADTTIPQLRAGKAAESIRQAFSGKPHEYYAGHPGWAGTVHDFGEATLGPNLYKLASTGHGGKVIGIGHLGPIPIPTGVVGDAATILPIFRGPKAALAGARALKEGETIGSAAKAARASLREPGVVAKTAHKARMVKLGDKSVQLPKSPSRITAAGQAAMDRTAERLTPTVNKLRESRSPVAQKAGKALTPLSARRKAPIAAGKVTRQEARRREAALAPEVKAIQKVGHGVKIAKSSGDQLAHFWWAQLPKSLRNAEGLKLVRSKLSEELEHHTSGRLSDELDSQLEALKAQQKAAEAAGDTKTVFESLGEQGKLRGVKADIPSRIADLSTNIKKLDKVISTPPRLHEEAIDALHALDKDRTDILVRAGKLDPERAAERRGLVSRWLGVEPTGEEAYMGHRLSGRPQGRFLPGAVSTGKTKLPEGVSRANKLVRASTGRVEQSLEPALRDWSAAQRYELQNVAKHDLAQMGEPVEGFVKPGYVVINPKGHAIPRHWKIDQEERAIAEGIDPEEILQNDLEEYVKNIMGEGPEAQRILEDAAKHGHLEDLRQLPADVVHRYYGQFLDPGVHAGTPGVKEGVAAALGKLDVVNRAIYTSLIFANPHYIPANSLQNLIMAGLHEGAFLPVNLARAGQIITRAPHGLRAKMIAEINHGATTALTGKSGKVIQAIQAIADNPSRLSAFIHEAAKAGVISKTKPWLTRADYAKLDDLLSNPTKRELLNDIRDRAVQAQVDFERLGPLERAAAKRLLFVWSWIRGASRYPFRFALDHPARSAGIGYTVAGAPGAPSEVQDKIHDTLPNVATGMPPYLKGALEAGDQTINGIPYPKILPTRGISPISTPVDLGETLVDAPGSEKVAGLLNPGIGAAWHVANRETPYGQDAGSYGSALEQAGERLAPDYGLASDLIHPPGPGTMYPGDQSRLGRLERASGVMPVAIDPEQAFQARVRAGMGSHLDAATHTLIRDSLHAEMGAPPKEVRDDLKWKIALDHEVSAHDTDKTGHVDYVKAAESAARIYDERYGTNEARYIERLRTQGEAQVFYSALRKRLYPAYSHWDNLAQRRLDAMHKREKVG